MGAKGEVIVKRLLAFFVCAIILVLPLAVVSDEPVLLGDVDENGVINRDDAFQILMRLTQGDARLPMHCDCDLDGVITAADVSLLLRYLALPRDFMQSGKIDIEDFALYSGQVESVRASCSDSRVRIRIEYDSPNRIEPGNYTYTVTLYANGYRIPGERRGTLRIEKPLLDVSGLAFPEQTVYIDLKNQFADHTIPIDLSNLPGNLSASVSGNVTAEEEEDRVISIDLLESSGLYQPIPKKYLLVHIRDRWSAWK